MLLYIIFRMELPESPEIIHYRIGFDCARASFQRHVFYEVFYDGTNRSDCFALINFLFYLPYRILFFSRNPNSHYYRHSFLWDFQHLKSILSPNTIQHSFFLIMEEQFDAVFEIISDWTDLRPGEMRELTRQNVEEIAQFTKLVRTMLRLGEDMLQVLVKFSIHFHEAFLTSPPDTFESGIIALNRLELQFQTIRLPTLWTLFAMPYFRQLENHFFEPDINVD